MVVVLCVIVRWGGLEKMIQLGGFKDDGFMEWF